MTCRRLTLAMAAVGALALAPAAHAQAAPVCPAGVPVQAITIINQAGARAGELSRAEQALIVQSRQLRDWWGTPCVTFTAGGWPIYLSDSRWDLHYAPGSQPDALQPPNPCTDALPTPCALVYWGTSSRTVELSHELLEMLVDPDLTGHEVCDPVEEHTYRLRGVRVEDFLTPAWFTGAPGPYDQMRLVHHPGVS